MGALSDNYNGTGKTYATLLNTSPKRKPFTDEMEKELVDSECFFEELDNLRDNPVSSLKKSEHESWYNRIRELRVICARSDRKIRELDYILNREYYKHWGVI